MRKFIKKILNLFGWLFLLLMILSVAASVVINIPGIQVKITDKGLGAVKQIFGTNVTYDNVKLRLFNRAEFEGILIRDLQNDTLLYASSLKASLPGIMQKVLIDNKIPVRVGKLHFDDAFLRLYIDSTKNINLKFIPDSIRARKNPDKNPEPLFIDNITIKNSRLNIHRFDSSNKDFGIDFKRMTFLNFNLDVNDLRVYADTVQMKVSNLELLENSGFHLSRFKANLHLSSQQLYFDEVAFRTTKSNMRFDYIHFDFNAFRDFGQALHTKVNISAACKPSQLFLDELSYFAPVFIGAENKLNLSGLFYGPISNLNGRGMNLAFGDESILRGRFDIIGLPNAEATFLIFDTEEFTTSISDVRSFKLPNNKQLSLPDKLSDVEYFTYKGNFTGLFTDFVSYGSFETNLGSANLDILFRPDSSNTLTFSGRLATDKFRVGEVLGASDLVGETAFNLGVNGRSTLSKGFDVNIDGEIFSLSVNDYKFKSIVVDGKLSEKKFHGNFKINDPNLRMNFDGLLDFSSDIRRYDFTANVFNANLYNIKLHEKDPNYTASFLVRANLSGNYIDNINGEVNLVNSLFAKSDAQIQVYDLNLNIRNDSLQNGLLLNSDFLDGEIIGHFKLSHLLDEYIHLADIYLPALDLYKDKKELLDSSEFVYSLRFKNSAPLFQYFIPSYSIEPNTIIKGELQRGAEKYAKLHMQSAGVKFKNSNISDLILNTVVSDSIAELNFGCKEFNLSKRLELDNFTLQATIDTNLLSFETRWLNWDTTLNKGAVSGALALKNKEGQKLVAKLQVDSSEIIISDSVWTLQPVSLDIDSNKIAVNNFNLKHNGEYFKAAGIISDNIEDSLYLDFNNFNFGNLNFFTRSSTFQFGGILNGDVVVHGRKKPIFFASLFVEALQLNNELIGDTYIDSRWNEKKELIEIEADVLRGKLKTLSISGDYAPGKANEFDLALNFNKFRLNFINPYLNTVFSDIRGLASGLITLTGTGKQPNLNGNLKLQKAALTVDYLQTRYNFTSDIAITNNNILFDGVELFDRYINTATLNGVVRTEYLKKFELNLSLQPQNFFCLNTTHADNPSFFGQAFATGIVRITGPTSELKFDVRATTEQGTQFSIPLSGTEELTEFDFIRMISKDTLSVEQEKEEYKVNLSGLQLDFDLNITPDAEVKIIFDPTVGDEIITRGNGELRVAINSLGDFKMLGDYVIESGTYLFTLQDVINKRFKVEQGSSLQWAGDPLNANININTYYRTKASLADLTGDQTSTLRYSIDCKLGLTGKLMEPVVNYDIQLPYAEQEQKDQVAAAIRSNEEMGKQFLSLLILNRFYYTGGGDNSTLGNTNIAGVNATELLSNQFSNWLSQISDDVDIGFNYRPGTEISSKEIEVALSTQLLNDRLSINGSVDVKTNAEAENTNNILGNLDVDYKITKNGKFRARVYNRANDNEVVRYSKYTQGVGVFYTEEFDKFEEIGSWYKRDKEKKKRRNNKSKKDKAVMREDDIPEE
jgi:hypothetical protein